VNERLILSKQKWVNLAERHSGAPLGIQPEIGEKIASWSLLLQFCHGRSLAVFGAPPLPA